MISIGLFVYNGVTYLRGAVESLIHQDFDDFELNICDNASTDGTLEVCEGYARADPRVRVYSSDRNRGAVWNAQRALALATRPYFMYASCHDLYHPSFIRKCLAPLQADAGVALAYPRTTIIDGNGDRVMTTPDCHDTRGQPRIGRTCRLIRDLNWCNMMYGLFRTDVLRRCRSGVNCIGPDMVLLAELSLLGTIAHVPEPLFFRREYRSASPTQTDDMVQLSAGLRLNPAIKMQRTWRPFTQMCCQILAGVWQSPGLGISKTAALPRVAGTLLRRWGPTLHHEMIRPIRPQRMRVDVPSY